MDSNVLILNKDNFYDETSNKSNIILVDFWSSTCAPCQGMMPIIEEVANYFNNTVLIAKFNVMEDVKITAAHLVRSVPTCILFKNGIIVDRFTGTKTKDSIIQFIEAHI